MSWFHQPLLPDIEFVLTNEFEKLAVAQPIGDGFLEAHAQVIARCQARRVPVLVCAVPASESNLAPIEPVLPDSPTNEQSRAHFLQGRALTAEGRSAAALAEL